MKNWVKRFTAVGLSAGLLAGTVFSPAYAEGKVDSKGKVGISAISGNYPFLQQKQDKSQKPLVSEDTLVVKYRSPISSSEHRSKGGTLVRQIPELGYAVVKVRDKANLHKVMAAYQKLGKVISVNPAVMYKSLGLPDPKINEQFHLSMLQIEKAQKLAGKNKVKVAVIDTGIDNNHPDLKGQLHSSYNVVNPMNPGIADYHGTHVAGILAAKKDNGVGGYGINPNAAIVPIDVFDRGWGASDYTVAQGILKAIDSGAKVINMSLGSSMPSPIIEEAVKKALAKNITIVAAAGNTGSDMISYPAGYEGVISVGAIDKNKKLASYSSFGPSVDIVAPGDEVYSTIYEYERKSSFRKLSGTSMASPVVAGVASLLLSKYPNLTPQQIEYILEHTATDLGNKGFDVKFGNGLVNPVNALKFDTKKLPVFTKKTLTEKEILAQAEAIKTAEPFWKEGTITKPYQEKWFKFQVEKGEYIQAVLEGANQYDYKMMINFYSPEGKLLTEVNKVREGKAEAKLIKAPYSGTVAIGIKDANGSYDDSGKNLSKYSVVIEKIAELPEDESSLENIIPIESLPYSSTELPLTYTGDEGDDDYFAFTVEEPQLVKITASGVPGVDSNLSVYMADQLVEPDMGDNPEGNPEENPEKDTEEGVVMASKEMQPDEYIEPMYYANSNGRNEGESLTFLAEPGMPYIIQTSNKQNYYFGGYEFYMDFDMFFEDRDPESSIIPYSLEVEGKVMPADEDGLPFYGYDEGEKGSEEGGIGEEESQLVKQREAIAAAFDPSEEEDPTEMIKELARPYTVGGTSSGYLQNFEDEDWFAVTPKETGIYEFKLLNNSELPMMEIYQFITEKDVDGEEYSYMMPIGGNMSYDWYYPSLNQKLYTGLKANETYYIKFNVDYFSGQISFDPYKFTSRLILKNPQDQYEDNDELEKVKNIPGTVFTGNFGMPMDQDVFYLQSKQDQVYGVTIERGALSTVLKRLPKEVVSPFYGFMVVVEDLNKNRKVDEEEYNYVQYIEKGIYDGTTYGSFKAGKNKNYILITSGWAESNVPLTLMPYKATVKPVSTKDEDAGNKVKSNVASKPIKMKQKYRNLWESTGYLNAGVAYGDQDWYTFTLNRNTSGVIKLEAPKEVDGKIAVYQNGKLIGSADYYAEGDAEVLSLNLKKGTYQIKVTDYFGNSTLNPYKLKVYMK